MEILISLLILLVIGQIILSIALFKRTGTSGDTNALSKIATIETQINRIGNNTKDDFHISREENAHQNAENRKELSNTLNLFREEILKNLNSISEQNHQNMGKLIATLQTDIRTLIEQMNQNNQVNRTEQGQNLQKFAEQNIGQLEKINTQLREALEKSIAAFGERFNNNVQSFNELQKEKFNQLETKQSELLINTDKRLEEMRMTVDEKLQKTLNERIGKSFETVSNQLEAVQKGLGEMRTLAQDVGGLKRVLSNVKMRGGIGEVQLSMLLDQILAPDQYEANVKTKHGSSDLVEFAIKLPGKDDYQSTVYLPVDAKFPKDIYEQLQNAYDTGETSLIEGAQKNLDNTIKKMAKDIRDKYLDPPHTTDFGIMFLPFEGIYAEVVRKASLLEDLQQNYKVIVTGPTTLAAILNSLQMGFRTLALQKRSSEVWTILGAVKTEFEKFGGLLEKTQKNLNSASSTIDELIGKRTNAIRRKLKDVQSLPASESNLILHDGSLPEN